MYNAVNQQLKIKRLWDAHHVELKIKREPQLVAKIMVVAAPEDAIK
jgi:hypothetical protein